MPAATVMLFVCLAFIQMATCFVQVPRARALMFAAVPGGYPTTTIGRLDLTEHNGMVTINGSLTGLSPGRHGFHIHEYGDLTNGCVEAGVHYNPYKLNHGGPTDSPSGRHVGDLGNIETPPSGPTPVNVQDYLITFGGSRGIIGRTLMVHSNEDDLGKGGDEESRRTGNAGRRVACGVIGIIKPGVA